MKRTKNSSFSSRSSNVPFTGRHVRCFVLQDTVSGRNTLFDNLQTEKQSPDVKKTPPRKKTDSGEYTSQHIHKNPRIDEALQEMIFGSIPVADVGINCKLHHIPHRNQVMLTLLFRYTPKSEVLHLEKQEEMNESSSQKLKRNRTTSVKLKKTEEKAIPSAINIQEEVVNSDVSGSLSSSFRRRSLSVGGKAAKLPDNSNKNEGCGEKDNKPSHIPHSHSHSRTHKITIALVVMITGIPKVNALQDMIHSHYSILNYRMRLLAQIVYESLGRAHTQSMQNQIGVTTSLNGRTANRHYSLPEKVSNGIEDKSLEPFSLQNDYILQTGVGDLQHCICTFMNYPRLQPAAWLYVVSMPDKRKNVLNEFTMEICSLISQLENKKTEYLLSRTLTTLLAYHPSWILTLNDKSLLSNIPLLKHDYSLDNQISQIFGCIVNPGRLCRVIVLGENKKLVCSLLFVLSFFIRCFALKFELLESQQDELFSNLEFSKTNTNISAKLSDIGSSIYQSNIKPSIWNQGRNINDESSSEISLSLVNYPELYWKSQLETINPFKNVGYSLFGSYCNHYTSDFVLMGLPKDTNNLTQYIARDLWAQCKFWPFSSLQEQKTTPSHTSSRDFLLDSSSCIVIDSNENTTKVLHFAPNNIPDPFNRMKPTKNVPHLYERSIESSSLVKDTLQTILFMYRSNFPTEGIIICLEDLLYQIMFKSTLVRRLVEENNNYSSNLSYSSIAKQLNLTTNSDVEMMAILQSNILETSIEPNIAPN